MSQTQVMDAILPRVLNEIDGMRDQIVDAVSRTVRIPSVDPKYPGQSYDELVGQEGRVSRVIAELYADAGCTVDVFAVEPGRENAVGVFKGTGGGRSLIFNGHIDVVPGGDPANWTSGDPFSGRVDGIRIWGRGSTDMKGGVVAQAFAAKALHQAGVKLRGDLILEAVVGEEVGDHEAGTTAVIKRGYWADAAVVAEPTAPPDPLAVSPVTPGLLWFSVTVKGKSAHAGMRGESIRAGGRGAEVGVNAIDKGIFIFQAIRQLEEQWGLSKRHPLFRPGHFAMLPGVITGSPRGILVPFFLSEYTTIEYCCLYHPDEDQEQVQQEIENQIMCAAQLDDWLREHPPHIESKLVWPAAKVDPSHPICLAVQDAHELGAVGSRFAGRPPMRGFNGVADVTWLNNAGIPAICYGPGDVTVAHADDEYVEIDELVTACRTYASLAVIWCGLENA